MNRNETSRRGNAFRALALSLFVTGCGNAVTRHEEPATVPNTASAYKPHLRTAEGLEERYTAAGVAEDAYAECLRRYGIDYRAEMQEYGEVAFWNNGAEHPAWNGCKEARENFEERMQLIAE